MTMWANLFYTNPDWIETLIRITLGVVFFAHGAQKLLGWFGGPGYKETMRTMHQFLGVPSPLAFLAIATEFFGGAALIVGLFSRVAALGIAVTMVVAIFTVHLQFGLFANWSGTQKGEGFEFHLLVLAITTFLMIRGGGAFSVDRALAGRR